MAPTRPAAGVPAARRAARLLIRRPDRVPDEDRDHRSRRRDRGAAIAPTPALARGSADLARGRQGQAFAARLTRATPGGSAEPRGFARGWPEARAAVEAGLTPAGSNGRAEGQVTRLTLRKRRRSGRATLDLLRRRALRAA